MQLKKVQKEEKYRDLNAFIKKRIWKSRNMQKKEIVREVEKKPKIKDQNFKKDIGFYVRRQKSNMNGRELSLSYRSH